MFTPQKRKKTLVTLLPLHEIISCALTALTIFFACALFSYKSTDPSWCYFTTSQGPLANWCGPVGAQSTSLLFYIVGSAAFLLLPFLMFITYSVIIKSTWADTADRYYGWALFIISTAALFHAYSLMIMQQTSSGGLVGRVVYEVLYTAFDRVGALIFISLVTVISCIFITRWSFIKGAHWLYGACRSLYRWCVRTRIISKVFHGIKKVFMYLSYPGIWILSFLRSLLDGSAFDKAELMYFSEGEVKEKSAIIPSRALQEDAHTYTPRVPSNSNLELEVFDRKDPVHGVKSEHMHAVSSLSNHEEVVTKKNVPHHSYELPSLDIFVAESEDQDDPSLLQELEQRAHTLEEKLARFGIQGKVTAIKRGPVVTVFEYKPDIDTKLSKILALEDDLAMALKALSIRILAPIPGRAVVGFEVANTHRKDVYLAEVIQSKAYQEHSGVLPLILGQDTIGNTVIVDLARMPHLLMAGSTGSGKSVALNTVLMSILCKKTPDEVQLILIDPKRLEFAAYADIAHLIFPIVVDPRKAAPVLKWVVAEMESRYERMAAAGARSIFDYNERMGAEDSLPFIVVVIDELADLMMTAGREVEDLIARIAQMARAAGIHMILATQRPSVDVITGLIKVNFPSRISFRVTSKIDSRTILDCGGAEKLLGRGDMLFLDSTRSTLQRVHGAYVSDDEIAQTVAHIRAERVVSYLDISQEIKTQENGVLQEDEGLYNDVCAFVLECDEISISLLQRKFRIGYNRSARIMDVLEQDGKILPADGGKMRKVVR